MLFNFSYSRKINLAFAVVHTIISAWMMIVVSYMNPNTLGSIGVILEWCVFIYILPKEATLIPFSSETDLSMPQRVAVWLMWLMYLVVIVVGVSEGSIMTWLTLSQYLSCHAYFVYLFKSAVRQYNAIESGDLRATFKSNMQLKKLWSQVFFLGSSLLIFSAFVSYTLYEQYLREIIFLASFVFIATNMMMITELNKQRDFSGGNNGLGFSIRGYFLDGHTAEKIMIGVIVFAYIMLIFFS